MVILLQLLNNCIVAFLTVFLVKKYRKRAYVVAIVPVVVGVIGMNVVERVSTQLSDPNVKVYLKEQKPGAITLEVQNGSRMAEAVDIGFHIIGNVTNIGHLSTGSMYGSLEKCKHGYNNPYARNTVKIHIEKLTSSGFITFFISYEQPPTTPEYTFFGLDTFSYRYTWNHSGNTLERLRWVAKTTGLEVQRPAVHIMGAIGDPRMSKEEYEKLGDPTWRCFE